MKQLCILAILLLPVFLSLPGQAQNTIRFTYDESGNRETRSVISLKRALAPNDALAEQQEETPLEDFVGLQETRIYPNPTKGLLRVEFPSLADREATIQVYDTNGRIRISQKAANTNQLDLSGYSPGLYILIIRSGQEKKEWKIIKE